MVENLIIKGDDGMTNYVMLFMGGILVGIAFYQMLPVEYGSVCNVVGIITLIYAVIWDR